MIYFIAWYFMISLLGWLVFPLTYGLLPSLADRGYAVSRALGLLLWGFIFWLLASLRILNNDPAGLIFALLILAGLSIWRLRGIGIDEIRVWFHQQRRMVITVEVVFLVCFAAWTFVRAANPEAAGTEKPMELAFINAILASPTFPPHDPWLSGYAISYYYFGYILVAMLAKMAACPGAIAFNLGISLVFGLSAAGAYGLVYNLLDLFLHKSPSHDQKPPPVPVSLPLLGPLFILVVSNLEGFLHLLHSAGLFWRQDSTGAWVSPFWTWLDINNLNVNPTLPFPGEMTSFWWWWRASRVVQDYDLANNAKEIIDEFPAFSYLLGDLHPHVLAMPFAFLTMTLALNIFLGGGGGLISGLQRKVDLRILAWPGTLAVPVSIPILVLGLVRLSPAMIALGILVFILGGFFFVRFYDSLRQHGLQVLVRKDIDHLLIGVPIHISLSSFLLSAIILGGMAFLNTWDFPFYLALFAAAYALGRLMSEKISFSEAAKDFFWLAMVLGISGIILYISFYLGFSSQAGGILPNLIYPTRGAHLWVMFAPLFLLIAAFLIYLMRDARQPHLLAKGLRLALGFTVLLWVLSLSMGMVIAVLPQIGDFYQSTLASPDTGTLLRAALARRLISPGGWITLVSFLTLTLALLLGLKEKTPDQDEGAVCPTRANVFALLLILWGLLLILGPEFFYLRDQFGWRINTIFKFYFQAWLLCGIAAAYAAAFLLVSLRKSWGIVFRVGMIILLAMCLVYPVFGLWSKTNGFHPAQWTLDSTADLKSQAPDEMAAIRWLQSAPAGVVAEAVAPGGGSYTNYARVSMLSGLPAVLGWIGHENQWRGGPEAMGSRQRDLERLYCSRDWNEAEGILREYNIRYVFIGNLERGTYQPNNQSCPTGLIETKFTRFLRPVYQQGSVTIYEYSNYEPASPES